MSFEKRAAQTFAASVLVLSSVALSGCSSTTEQHSTGCVSDSECLNGQTCEDGVCVGGSGEQDAGHVSDDAGAAHGEDAGSVTPVTPTGCGFTNKNAACESCIESSSCCALGATCAANTSCTDALSCAQDCASGDQSCVDSCLSGSGGTALEAFLNCTVSECSACNTTSTSATCTEGAAVVCACAALAGEPCTEAQETNAYNNCTSNTDPSIACLAAYSSVATTVAGCEEALNACPN